MLGIRTFVHSTALVVMGFALPGSAIAGQDRVDLCHPNAHGMAANLLTVSESSVEAHLAHGDWAVSRELRGDELDNDCDGAIDEHEPVAWSWDLWAGVRDGQLADAWSNGAPVPPMLLIYLFDEEFMATWSEADLCVLPFIVESTSGAGDPDAWFDWALKLVPSEDHDLVCDNLDPAAFEGDPWETFSNLSWEFSVVPLDAATSEIIQSWYPGTIDYVYGGDTWINGVPLSEWEGTDYMVNYGWAWAVDDAMEIGDELLETEEVAAGADGYYLLTSIYFIGTFEL